MMRRSRRRLLAGTIPLILSMLFWAPAHAEAPHPPPYYAITNVKVVTGTGKTLESATVLLADGLIAAVGTKIELPADAWVIDGQDLTLYPGLFDAMTSLGQKKGDEENSERGGGGGFGGNDEGPKIRGPEDRPKTTPWVSATDDLVDDGKVKKWREAGFTTAMTVPTEGIFAGQGAVINLGDEESNANVVATDVAQKLSFKGGGFRAYPGSLMGVLAYIMQVFEDTNHYTQVKSDYDKNPAGRVRPTYDRTLEPLERALADRTPFLMPGQLGRQLDRALALSESYELNTIIYGGQGAYARTEQLKASNSAVLVSLNWPEEAKDRDPDLDTPIRTLIHRRLAVTTPAALSEAGVPFAFYSDGLASSKEVFESVRAAIDGGLSEQDALRALSSGAASIYGVDDRLGTIEEGKIANLILANDWPWSEGCEVEAVFVDGRKYQERKDDEPKEAPAQDVSGTWSWTMVTPRGSNDMTAEIEMSKDGKVTGEIEGRMGTTQIDEGRMSGDLLRFETTREFGGRSMTAKWSLTVEGETLSGSMSAGPMAMDVSGERTATPDEADAKDTDESDSGEPVVALEELREALPTIQGKVKAMDTYAITNATIWTLAGENIENGMVVVKGGKIAAVGTELSIPSDAEIIDAEGGSLIPGIIDCHSHIAIEGGVNEGTLAVTAMVSIGDVVNPDDIAIYRALAGGVTSANLLHGSANPIGGRNQVVKLRWGASAEGMKFEDAPKGIKFALGENPKRSNFRGPGIPQRYPQTRMGVMDVIRQAFTDALEYQEAWQAYEKGNKKRGGVKPMLPRRDLELETLVEILQGERLVHSHCYRADEILQLMLLAEEFGFTIGTLQHVLEGYKVADEIAAHGAGASTFSDWWGYKVEAYEAIPYNAALMTERGVTVSINSDSGEEIRHLNQEAGKSVKWGGMDEIEALKMVTLNPAIQLGVSDRVGSIEVGKEADLVIYDGHPLAIRSVVQKTFIDGDLYFDLEADRARQALIDDLKLRMLDKDEEEEKEDEVEPTSTTPTLASQPPPEVRWSAEKTYSCHDDGEVQR